MPSSGLDMNALSIVADAGFYNPLVCARNVPVCRTTGGARRTSTGSRPLQLDTVEPTFGQRDDFPGGGNTVTPGSAVASFGKRPCDQPPSLGPRGGPQNWGRHA